MTDARPLPIAFIVHTFHTGGIERCVAHLCNHLDRDRFQPMVICLGQSGAAVEWLERDDVEIIEIRKKPSNDWRAVRRLARVLKARKVSVVHSHNWGTLVETSLARRNAGVPVHVHTEHGQGLHEGLSGLKRMLRNWACRWAFGRADAVVVCADSVRPLISARCGFPEQRILHIANGIALPQTGGTDRSAAVLRRELGMDEHAFVIGSVGRLEPVKGFELLVEATRILHQRHRNVHCVLIGDGSERDRLSAAAADTGCSQYIHFVGRRNHVGDWLKLMDVYVNSSHSEAMSMGILEAMAMERPVIATDVGDNGALLGGERRCGVIVPAGDPGAMADAVTDLIADPAKRAVYGAAGRERYENEFTVTQMADRHAELYVRLLPSVMRHGTAAVIS